MRQVLIKAASLFAASVLPLLLLAQLNITSTVVDIRNSPVAGASVRLKNTTTGTTTDANGKFSLTIPGTSATLEITSVGYQPQTVQVSSGSELVNVTLVDDVSNLNEVVITGLATGVKRTNVAHAVATVSAKSLTGTTVQPTLDGALYGKITGANISTKTDRPG